MDGWMRRWILVTCSAIALLPAAPSLAQNGAGSPESGTLVYKDARLSPAPPPREWNVFYPRAAVKPLGPDRDPKFNVLYPLRRYVLCRDGDDAQVRFVVHYLKPEDLPLAQRTGGVLARLYWVARDYLALSPSEARPVDVWLTHSGEAGGEEWGRNIYLFAVDEARAPAEWVRELAHEYAHLVLPELGPFTMPEQWASGYLGERLFMKWLLLDNGAAEIWGEPIRAADYVALQVAPLRDRFLKLGPEGPEADREPMNTLIGELLALEAAHGPSLLRNLFGRFKRGTPEQLAGHLAVLLRQTTPPLPVDPTATVPGKTQYAENGREFQTAAYRVFLPGGTWRVEAEGAPDTATVMLDGAALKRAAGGWEARLDAPTGAWHLLQLTADGRPFTLHSLQLRRVP